MEEQNPTGTSMIKLPAMAAEVTSLHEIRINSSKDIKEFWKVKTFARNRVLELLDPSASNIFILDRLAQRVWNEFEALITEHKEDDLPTNSCVPTRRNSELIIGLVHQVVDSIAESTSSLQFAFDLLLLCHMLPNMELVDEILIKIIQVIISHLVFDIESVSLKTFSTLFRVVNFFDTKAINTNSIQNSIASAVSSRLSKILFSNESLDNFLTCLNFCKFLLIEAPCAISSTIASHLIRDGLKQANPTDLEHILNSIGCIMSGLNSNYEMLQSLNSSNMICMTTQHQEPKEKNQMFAKRHGKDLQQIQSHACSAEGNTVQDQCSRLTSNEFLTLIGTLVIEIFSVLTMNQMAEYQSLILSIALTCHPAIWNNIDHYTNSKNSESESNPLEKLEQIIWKGATSKSHHQRKVAFELINILSSPAAKTSGWIEFRTLVETLESYSHHLLTTIWDKAFLNFVSIATGTSHDVNILSRKFRQRFEIVNTQALKCLIQLGLQHENPSASKFIIDHIISQSSIFLCPLVEESSLIAEDHSQKKSNNNLPAIWFVHPKWVFQSIMPHLCSIPLLTRTNGSKLYRDHLLRFIHDFIFLRHSIKDANQKDEIISKSQFVRTIQSLRGQLLLFMMNQVHHHLSMGVFLESLQNGPVIPLVPTETLSLIALLEKINFGFACQTRAHLSALIFKLLHHNGVIRYIGIPSMSSSPTQTAEEFVLQISSFFSSISSSFIATHLSLVQLALKQFLLDLDVISIGFNILKSHQKEPMPVNRFPLVGFSRFLSLYTASDPANSIQIVKRLQEELIMAPAEEFISCLNLCKFKPINRNCSIGVCHAIIDLLCQIVDHISQLEPTMNEIFAKDVPNENNLKHLRDQWRLITMAVHLSTIFEETLLFYSIKDVDNSNFCNLYQKALNMVHFIDGSSNLTAVTSVIILSGLLTGATRAIQPTTSQFSNLLMFNESTLRNIQPLIVPVAEDASFFNAVSNAFTIARWRCIGNFDLTSLNMKPSDTLSIAQLSNEALQAITISDTDNMTIFYIWVLEQLTLTPLIALPVLFQQLQSKIFPFLFNPDRPFLKRVKVLELVACKFHQLIIDLGTGAIGSRTIILQQLAESVLGNSEIIATDLESSTSPILNKCVQKILVSGNRIIGLTRIFTIPFLFGLRTLLNSGNTTLIKYLPKLTSTLMNLLVYKEPSLDNSIETEKNLSLLPFQDYKEQRFQYFLSTSAYVRFSTLTFIEWVTGQQKTVLSNSLSTFIFLESISQLNSIRVEMNKNKTPALPCTSFHRRQIRLWQVLCCLSTHFEFIQKVVSSNVLQYHQLWTLFEAVSLPDIRHLMEVFFSRLVLSSPSLSIPFLVNGLSNYNAPNQQIESYIVVTGSLLLLSSFRCDFGALFTNNFPIIRLSNNEVEQLITTLLPLACSNNALVRGTLHLVFFELFTPESSKEGTQQNIWEPTERHPYLSEVLKKHSGVSAVIQFITQNKECVRMRRRLKPILQSWDVAREQTLLWLLPEESIKEQSDWNNHKSEFDELDVRVSWILVSTLKTTITEILSSSFYPDSSAVDSKTSTVECVDIIDYQRKFQPNENSTQIRERFTHNRNSTELIVAASLVDKLPNLAGLTRTAEIFGANRLLLPNLTVLRDPVFASCSVTSHLWLPLSEVPPNDLSSVLLQYQREGYTIVALEQTNNSVQLDRFQFPLRTVLVLGSEKEGIPQRILSLVHICVEIPQRGIIRSLNVHVSAALAMWQYTIQQK